MKPPGYDLIGVGLMAVDVLVRLPQTVLRDDKQMVDDLMIQGGAPVGSGICGVARLGYPTGIIGRLGKNMVSAICLEEFRSFGVQTELVVRDEISRPAIALVEIDPLTSGRTVFIQMENYGFLLAKDIPVDVIRSARALLVDSYDLKATELALLAAKDSNCRTVLDFESGDRDALLRLLPLGTDIILPLACARVLTGNSDPGEALRGLSKYCTGQLVTTDGLHGSWALDREKDEIVHCAAFRVQSIDSTGCGDAYHAGYIVGMLEGWPLPLRMELGSLLASIVSTRVGGRTALPSRVDLVDGIPNEVSEKLRNKLLKLL